MATKFFTIALIVLTGCSFFEPEPTVRVITDRGIYSLPSPTEGVVVSYTVKNSSSSMVWIPRCGDVFVLAVDLWVDDDWWHVDPGTCPPEMQGAPFLLGVGEEAADQALFLSPGKYRIGVTAYDPTGRSEEWYGVSNEFEVF